MAERLNEMSELVARESFNDIDRGLAVGDHVLGWTDTQTAARTQLIIAGSNLTRKPPALSWAVAGALPTAPGTRTCR